MTARPRIESPNGFTVPSAPLEDELDISSIRLSPGLFDSIGTRKLITTVPVRRPSRQTWVRVHPDPAWRVDAAILQLKEDDRDVFLVLPAAYDALADEVSPMKLYTTMSRQGTLTLWPVRLPGSDGRLDDWSCSAHAAAARATEKWVRVVGNRSLGAYEVLEALVDIPDPEWPELSFERVLYLAFRDRRIESIDHPVLKQLQGRA
jgi:hypothetical protein